MKKYWKYRRHVNDERQDLETELEELIHSESTLESLHMSNQAGAPDFVSMLKNFTSSKMQKHASSFFSKQMLQDVADMLSLLTIFCQGSFAAAIAGLNLYCNRYCKEGTVQEVIDYVTQLFQVDMTNQSDENTTGIPTSILDSKDWVEFSKNVRDNWKLCKSSPLFGHFSNLLGLLVTMKMCEEATVTFSINEYKLLVPNQKLLHKNAFDVLDATFDTVAFFAESISLCMEQKSLIPLLLGPDNTLKYDEKYATICSHWKLVQQGNLKKQTGLTDHEFDNQLAELTNTTKKLMTGKANFEKKILTERYMKLLEIRNDFTTLKLGNNLRKAPYALEFFGPSGVGKTALSKQIMNALLVSAGLPTDTKFQATLNPTEQYMSTWKTEKHVMIIDDCCNENEKYTKQPPTRFIIDVCNNQPFVANMADLNEKGKVYVEPSLVIVTTNVKDLNAAAYSNCPYSVQRRMNNVVTCRVKKQFRKRDQQGDLNAPLCRNAVNRFFAGKRKPQLDDFWEITISRASPPESLKNVAPYEILKNSSGVEMKDIDLKTALQFLIEDFTEHNTAQQDFLDRENNRADTLERCDVDGCCQIRGYCHLHAAPEPVLEEVVESETPKDDEPQDDNLWFWQRWMKKDEEELTIDEPEKEVSLNTTVKEILMTRPDPPPVKTALDADDPPSVDQSVTSDVTMDNQFGHTIVKTYRASRDKVFKKVLDDSDGLPSYIEGALGAAMTHGAHQFVRNWDWVSWVPTPWFEHPHFRRFMMGADKNRLYFSYGIRSLALWGLTLGFSYACFNKAEWKNFITIPIGKDDFGVSTNLSIKEWDVALASTMSALWYAFHAQRGMGNYVQDIYARQLRDRHQLDPYYANIREQHVARILKASSIIFAIYMVREIYKAAAEIDAEEEKKEDDTSKKDDKSEKKAETKVDEKGNVTINGTVFAPLKEDGGLQNQGTLEPKTIQDVLNRDSESNVWCNVVKRPLVVSQRAACTTSAQLREIVKNNLVHGTVPSEGAKVTVLNALFLKTNVVAIPAHYFKDKDSLNCTFRKCNPESCGGKFVARLHKSHSVKVGELDLMICYCSNGGSFKNILKYLPEEITSSQDMNILYRSIEGECEIWRGKGELRTVSTPFSTNMPCLAYNLDKKTFGGMCGAVGLSYAKPAILSIHTAGVEGTQNGAGVKLEKASIVGAITELSKLPGVLIGADEPASYKDQSGDQSLNKNSSIRYMPLHSQIQYHGSCEGGSKFFSDVKSTLISESVEKHMSKPNIYRGPVTHPSWFGWQTCLENMSNPATPFEANLIVEAIKDYEEPLISLCKSDLWKSTKPLTNVQAINGIAGVRFIDAMKRNTSAGYGFKGKKIDHMYVKSESDSHIEYDFVPEMWTEIDRCLDAYRISERAYPIAKACKKDEVLTKDKCRIFYGGATSLTFIVRKYFLPLVRILQMNPLVSECSVGINCYSEEWAQLYDRVLAHGKDRIFGGDYGKYDQKLPAQVLLAAFRVLVDMAEALKWSDEDLTIMRAVSADVVYSVIAFDGAIISLTEGTHISGNPLTVILNGISGSLNMRCYYYSKRWDERDKLKFREDVAFMTYGDDNIGSVKKGVDFTIKGASEFLAKYGQTYTMPDKTSELKDFLPEDDFEFLKRKSVYLDDIGHVGALATDSVTKSLHCYLRGRKNALTEEEACAQNIDNAVMEFWYHGKDVYESRRKELIAVAEETQLSHLCQGLNRSYEDRKEEWLQKYKSSHPVQSDGDPKNSR